MTKVPGTTVSELSLPGQPIKAMPRLGTEGRLGRQVMPEEHPDIRPRSSALSVQNATLGLRASNTNTLLESLASCTSLQDGRLSGSVPYTSVPTDGFQAGLADFAALGQDGSLHRV